LRNANADGTGAPGRNRRRREREFSVSRRPAKLTQSDIRRALRAAAALNGAYQVEVAPADGTIRFLPVDPHHISGRTADPDKWEERLLRANPDWK
jgi:hypothetical protein